MENLKNINPIKVDKTTIINLEKGKLPPQALDLEEAVLGAMMIDKKGVDEVIDILQSDAFYKDAHKHIHVIRRPRLRRWHKHHNKHPRNLQSQIKKIQLFSKYIGLEPKTTKCKTNGALWGYGNPMSKVNINLLRS